MEAAHLADGNRREKVDHQWSTNVHGLWGEGGGAPPFFIFFADPDPSLSRSGRPVVGSNLPSAESIQSAGSSRFLRFLMLGVAPSGIHFRLAVCVNDLRSDER